MPTETLSGCRALCRGSCKASRAGQLQWGVSPRPLQPQDSPRRGRLARFLRCPLRWALGCSGDGSSREGQSGPGRPPFCSVCTQGPRQVVRLLLGRMSGPEGVRGTSSLPLQAPALRISTPPRQRAAGDRVRGTRACVAGSQQTALKEGTQQIRGAGSQPCLFPGTRRGACLHVCPEPSNSPVCWFPP